MKSKRFNCRKCKNCVSWRRLGPEILAAVDTAQRPWIGTRYSAHQRGLGDGVSCYTLIAEILDTLYRRAAPTPMPFINTNAGICGPEGKELVFAFRRNYPLDEVESSIEPGDLIVTRSVPGDRGPDWEGHVMMAGIRKGQVIHTLPSTGVVWGSLTCGLGRVLKIYRPRDKASWTGTATHG